MRSLEQVLAAGEIYIAYQPIIDLRTKKIFSFEALVRSAAPEFPGPMQIIKAAVENNYMAQLGRALRKLSVEGCPNHPLFLNIHPNEFSAGWLVRPDDAIHLHESQIYLEITESVPLSHHEHCHSVLKEIRAKDIKIAVDDLGAGYSNLKYIADLAPEIVKLDRELIENLDKKPRLKDLVESIVQLCVKQGALVVAEGIETHEELVACMEAGAHLAQGFYLARPNAVLPDSNWAEIIAGKK